MKALTLFPRHADAIARGEKWVENRTWQTGYRGPVAIHAGVGGPREELAQFPSRRIVAIADLVAVRHLNDLYAKDRDRVLHDCGLTPQQIIRHAHTIGPQCWIFKSVRPVDIPWEVGLLGLWNIHPYDLPDWQSLPCVAQDFNQ
jgi:hypothetical protein